MVTLLYLAVQVRQNTSALKTASRQEVVSAFRDYNRLMFDSKVDRAMRLGLRQYPDMPDEKAARFSILINDQALFFQGAFALHEAGTLESETYGAYLQFFSALLATPGGRRWWSEISPLYPPRMVSAIDERLARDDLPDLLQLPSFQEPPTDRSEAGDQSEAGDRPS